MHECCPWTPEIQMVLFVVSRARRRQNAEKARWPRGSALAIVGQRGRGTGKSSRSTALGNCTAGQGARVRLFRARATESRRGRAAVFHRQLGSQAKRSEVSCAAAAFPRWRRKKVSDARARISILAPLLKSQLYPARVCKL